MKRNRPMVAFLLLAGAAMTPLFPQGAQAQSAHILAYSEEEPGDVPDRQSPTQSNSVAAPNRQPTDLLGDIWKRSNHPNATGNDRGVRGVNAASGLTTSSPKPPAADLTAAVK